MPRWRDARTLDEALALLAEDVDWPNVREQRRLQSRGAVRDYWLTQWQLIDSHIEPHAFHEFGDRLVIRVHQRVTDKSGSLIADHVIGHVLTFDGEAIARLDIYASERAALAAVAPVG